MVAPDFDKALLLLVVYREARGEGLEGMRAVAHVIRNRVTKGWGNWSKVITAKNQFSSISVTGDSQTVVFPDAAAVDSLLQLIEGVYGGTDKDITNGALYYANEATVTSNWYTENIIKSGYHPITAQIRKHTFRA